jgi:hypothetical protein
MGINMAEARVILKISNGDSENFETYRAALIYEQGRPYAVELHPADRIIGSMNVPLHNRYLEEQPSTADGVLLYRYRATVTLSRPEH